ncbi:MAG: Crp/Fnr family transcriptional regulator [Fibrobacterota bacterium]
MCDGSLEQLTEHVPLFKDLSKADREAICKAMILRKFQAGQIILHEEDNENHTFFIIASGIAHVTVQTNEGKNAILASLHKGDFFGEMAILDGDPRSASIIAATDCELLMLYRRSFMEILQKYPPLTIQMLMTMSRRIRKSNRHINTLSLMSVYGRVADVILQLAREQGQKIGDMIIIPNRPTHQAIADMAGTSRETVSRILSQLQKKHYITLDRKKMVILNEKKLYD